MPIRGIYKTRLIVDPEDPRLHAKNRKVENKDRDDARMLADRMIRIAQDMGPRCVGLAAPQIGVNYQLIIVRHNGVWVPMANPRIVEIGQDMEQNYGPEGCLSHPGITVDVPRYKEIVVVADDIMTGKEEKLRFVHVQEFEDAGYYPQLVRIMQHEIDHLNHTLITDVPGRKNFVIDRTGQELIEKSHAETLESGGYVEPDV